MCRHSQPDRARSAQEGHTLFELLIAVGLIAMLAAIALPSVRAVDDQGLDTTAAWVAETVRFARSEAVRTGRPVYVEVDRDTDRMLVAEANLAGPTAAAGATLRDP